MVGAAVFVDMPHPSAGELFKGRDLVGVDGVVDDTGDHIHNARPTGAHWGAFVCAPRGAPGAHQSAWFTCGNASVRQVGADFNGENSDGDEEDAEGHGSGEGFVEDDPGEDRGESYAGCCPDAVGDAKGHAVGQGET